MSSIDREEIQEHYDELRAVVSRILGHSYEPLTNPERFGFLEVLEHEIRRLQVPCHQLINQLAEQSDAAELGGRLSHALADRLRITRGEAGRWIAEAADLGPRRALTGEPLPPLLTGSAAAQCEGTIGGAHVQVIRRFLGRVPCSVDIGTREAAEKHLARLSTQFRPDQVAGLADRLADCLNPDGTYTDEDRARRRGLTFGKQGPDGMSQLRGWMTPEARATIEAVLAKTAAPGLCNPGDDVPVVDGPPGDEAVQHDTRSTAQRNHDGLNAALRATLASGNLGQHNGLPATIIISTTLEQLESASGTAITGGGARVPMSDVIRMARHAHHYLAIFDKGKAVALYHARRLAAAGQRIMLYAKDRGCTRPGCDVSGYWCEVHHVDGWAGTRHTDVDTLTLACGPHHALVKPGAWTTRKRANGDTEWIPPPHLDHGQPRTNAFHHPERLLGYEGEADGAA